MKLTIEQLRLMIQAINAVYGTDKYLCHRKIDELMLEYIDDVPVSELYHEIEKFY